MERPLLPPPLQLRKQTPCQMDDIPLMTTLRALPRELLLQQQILGLKGSMQCFHCEGVGRTSSKKGSTILDQVKLAFANLDSDGDALISVDELTRTLQALDRKAFTAKAIETIVSGFDVDGDGKLNFDEFLDWIFSPGPSQAKRRTSMMQHVLTKVVWLYEEGRGSWHVFDKPMAITLEQAYAEGVGAAVRVLGWGPYEYIIDLSTMTQENMTTHKQRRVLRAGEEPAADSDAPELWFQARPKWTWGRPGSWNDYDVETNATLEAYWQSYKAGSATCPTLKLHVDGKGVWEFDVEQMTQTNPKSGKTRGLRRFEDGGARRDPEPLVRVPSDVARLPDGVCWVCRGSGQTSSFLKPIDDAAKFNDLAPDEGEVVDCLVCYCEVATYGISRKCDHVFCDTCIDMSLQAMMDSGQFPAYCPMCRAEAGGDPETGQIEGEALTFLQQRGVITKQFQLRLLKQQNKILGIEEADMFDCPGKCGELILKEDPSYAELHVGEVFTDADGEVGVRLGMCTSCEAHVCIKCEQRERANADGTVPTHKCEDLAKKLAESTEPDEATLAVMASIGKKCPVCGVFIQKNEGCDYMMCGTAAHGHMSEVLKNGGCGIAFQWGSLAVCDDPCGWHDIDGQHKRGRPVTVRQLIKNGIDHPKCQRPGCDFFKTVDGLGPGLAFHTGPGTQAPNNGGEYCCEQCGKDGSHSNLCHKISIHEKRR